MPEPAVFETRFAAAYRRYLDEAPAEIDAAAVARAVTAAHPRARSGSWRWALRPAPALAWLLLLALLLVALSAAALFVGSQQERKLPAVIPPVGQAFVCPPGSTPDRPGPVEQARPVGFAGPMAFDRRAGKLIALAGGYASPATVVETWTFDVCTNTWTRMHPNREPLGQVRSLVYDVDSDLTIGVHSEDWLPYPETGTRIVWVYDLEANTWTAKGFAPTSELGFYDPVSGLVVSEGVAGDLWNYDVQTDKWTPIKQAILREDLGISVYDPSVDRIIFTGGSGVAETWLLDLRTGAWSRSGTQTPSFKMGMWAVPAIVYDEAAERTVVAGDFQWGAYDATADRWEILSDAQPVGPLPKPAVYDPVNRRLIFVGGGIGVSGDLVAFDLATREWTVLLAASGEQPASSSR
jgi:hypothetical protein